MTKANQNLGLNADQQKKIGLALKKLRLDKNFKSYDHMAFELKISRSHYSKYERGENMTFKSLFKILDFHQITFLDFVEKYVKNV